MLTFKNCRHLMSGGRACKSPAMRGSAYCYAHTPDKVARRPVPKPQVAEDEIETVPMQDAACVVVMIDRILNALAKNRISVARASVMLQGLQTVLSSWRNPPLNDEDEDDYIDPNLDPGYNFVEELRAKLAARSTTTAPGER